MYLMDMLDKQSRLWQRFCYVYQGKKVESRRPAELCAEPNKYWSDLYHIYLSYSVMFQQHRRSIQWRLNKCNVAGEVQTWKNLFIRIKVNSQDNLCDVFAVNNFGIGLRSRNRDWAAADLERDLGHHYIWFRENDLCVCALVCVCTSEHKLVPSGLSWINKAEFF